MTKNPCWLAASTALLAGALGCSTTECPGGPTSPSGAIVSGLARRGMPDRREVFALLSRASDVSLVGNPSCDGVVPENDAPTLGDWVGYNLSVLEGERVWLDAECVAAETPDEWRCDVTFHAEFDDSPDPWSWGVRFRMRETDRSLVPDSLLCTGAG